MKEPRRLSEDKHCNHAERDTLTRTASTDRHTRSIRHFAAQTSARQSFTLLWFANLRAREPCVEESGDVFLMRVKYVSLRRHEASVREKGDCHARQPLFSFAVRSFLRARKAGNRARAQPGPGPSLERESARLLREQLLHMRDARKLRKLEARVGRPPGALIAAGVHVR